MHLGGAKVITVHGGVTKLSLSVFNSATDLMLAAFKCNHISQTWCSLMQLFVRLVPIPYFRLKGKISDENSKVKGILQTLVPISS